MTEETLDGYVADIMRANKLAACGALPNGGADLVKTILKCVAIQAATEGGAEMAHRLHPELFKEEKHGRPASE